MNYTRQDDKRVLRMLDMRDGAKMNAREIAEACGVTTNSVRGELWRIGKAEMPCACLKAENQDGGMSRGWWK